MTTTSPGDIDNREVHVGDVVIYHSDTHPGLQRGCVMDIENKLGVCRIAGVGTPPRAIELVIAEDTYIEDTAYRGKHPSLLRELFPYRESDYRV